MSPNSKVKDMFKTLDKTYTPRKDALIPELMLDIPISKQARIANQAATKPLALPAGKVKFLPSPKTVAREKFVPSGKTATNVPRKLQMKDGTSGSVVELPASTFGELAQKQRAIKVQEIKSGLERFYNSDYYKNIKSGIEKLID